MSDHEHEVHHGHGGHGRHGHHADHGHHGHHGGHGSHGGAGAGAAGPGPAASAAAASPLGGFSGLLRDDFTRGVVVGAATTYLLTNPKVQKVAMTTAVRLWDAVQGSMAELRERFQDAEAEMHKDGGTPSEES